MRKSMKALAVTSTVALGLAAAPALFAHEPGSSGGSMMREGGMMGQGGMMGMMNVMRQMNDMMESCNEMMRGAVRQPAPETPKEGTPREKKE